MKSGFDRFAVALLFFCKNAQGCFYAAMGKMTEQRSKRSLASFMERTRKMEPGQGMLFR